MRVCDRHRDRESVDTLHVERDGTQIDVCDECKYAVLNFFSGAAELEHKDKKSFVQKVLGK